MRKTINILFLGGAKRVSMARKFKEAGARRGYDVNIFSYELDYDVPIASIATVVKGLRWNDPEVLESLHRVVADHAIDMMIPFVDMLVGVASRYAERYADVFAPVSRPELCDIMFDKVLSDALFERHSIARPPLYQRGRPSFPLIAKPRFGSASKGIKVVNNAVDFRSVIARADDYLIQKYIPNRREYTVDCYVSATGSCACISPRLRVEVIGGEVSRTVTVDDPALVEASRRAITAIGLRGAVTLQFLRDVDTDSLMIMEINPRLGGGAVCSVHAGADLPGMIIDEFLGVEPSPASPRPGVEIARYFEEVVFNK